MLGNFVDLFKFMGNNKIFFIWFLFDIFFWGDCLNFNVILDDFKKYLENVLDIKFKEWLDNDLICIVFCF